MTFLFLSSFWLWCCQVSQVIAINFYYITHDILLNLSGVSACSSLSHLKLFLTLSFVVLDLLYLLWYTHSHNTFPFVFSHFHYFFSPFHTFFTNPVESWVLVTQVLNSVVCFMLILKPLFYMYFESLLIHFKTAFSRGTQLPIRELVYHLLT